MTSTCEQRKTLSKWDIPTDKYKTSCQIPVSEWYWYLVLHHFLHVQLEWQYLWRIRQIYESRMKLYYSNWKTWCKRHHVDLRYERSCENEWFRSSNWKKQKNKVIVMHIVSFQSSPWCNFEKVSVQIDAASLFRHNLSIRLKNIESEKVSSTYDGNLFIRKSSKWS